MNVVEGYYFNKLQNGEDKFYDRIEEKDIEILRRAKVYMYSAPLFTVGVCFGLVTLKN